MKWFFSALLVCLLVPLAKAAPVHDSLLTKLDRVLNKEAFYVNQKLEQINAHKTYLASHILDLNTQYLVLDSIFEAYKSFHYDSAFRYIIQVQKISYKLHNPEQIAKSKIKLGFIFLSSGMFKEAFDSLSTIKPKRLPESVKSEYYAVMAVLNYNLSDLQDSYYAPIYEQKAHQYVDSVLLTTDANSYKYLYYKGLRHVRKYEFEQSLNCLRTLRARDSLSLHQKAIISSTLSDVYINYGDDQKAAELLAEAAGYDIISATKETAAILNLAHILYRQGDIKQAYIYTKRALENANFYGARHRKIQVGSILPIIEEEKINTVEKQKKLLLTYSLVVTLLSIVIVVFIRISLKQLKKIKKADKEIVKTNQKLRSTNQKLLEANKIKEEYIGYYFSNNSGYIDKIENLKNSIEKNLAQNKFDNVRYLIDKVNLKKERTELYQAFDRVFLNLFPDFIRDFNALFDEANQIQPDSNELLNTDLRIFALIRLGITENDKIAKILGFSVNTIYTYKTKIKNKSRVANEDFEKQIMNIKVI